MIAALFCLGYLGLLAAKAAMALRSVGCGPQPGPFPFDFSTVVIAQPILSGDPSLQDVLQDNVRALPTARFVWLVDSDDPVGGAICKGLQRAWPAVHIDVLVFPPPPDGCNPKLFKLERARAMVGDGVLLVLDDDTRLPPESLAALLTGLSASDVATGLPAYLDDGRWPSRLLAQFVNNNAALTYLPLLTIAPPPTINGMAYAMRGSTIERLGGFGPIMDALTDDLAVARLVIGSGGCISQTAWPQWVQTTVTDGAHYVKLMHRWFLFANLLLKRQSPRLRATIALLHGLPAVLLWGAVISAVLSPNLSSLLALGTLVLLRSVGLSTLQRRVYGRSLHHPVSSLMSELLQPWHMLHAALVHTIVWRTRRYHVRDDHSFSSVS